MRWDEWEMLRQRRTQKVFWGRKSSNVYLRGKKAECAGLMSWEHVAATGDQSFTGKLVSGYIQLLSLWLRLFSQSRSC